MTQICSCSKDASNSPRAQAEIFGSLLGHHTHRVLIPSLRKLITDKAETLPAEMPATVVPVA
jgi:hypothetical protein